mmetsp:Transcript_5326/g.14834  ORF Transcript_5326/g.14834 Transcript_5326/m.14834 type:complete len:157 (-) Transcript_5326:277-747(-)|eukprot:CAMPEP_0117660188 /NCGR_PEP_ID=MMETSP0804-20121206/6835_1 /TAXON_ID=1074897 /ORGANISM="Tetraselmis astigmatica, Strain CCMP880" /LENGTH=156 /DNA_ID=CAMNT_0005466901 /DNA_START=90 /DNA_END=560 /DNA_ORIENTATION=-
MVCYNIFFFDRSGQCLYTHEWRRTSSVKQGCGTVEDEYKNAFGLFFSLKRLTAALDPSTTSKPSLMGLMKIGEGCTFHSFTTNVYKFHFLESASGIKIVLNTSPEVGDLREVMQTIYSSIYVEYVVKNPLYQLGSPFQNDSFTGILNKYIKSQNLT